jgi:hypothetical protein
VPIVSNTAKIIGVGVLVVGSVVCFASGWFWPGVALAAATVVVFAWAAVTFQRPALKVKSAELTLRLLDAKGEVARFEKKQEIVPVRRPLADIRDRNLFTKGRLDDFEVAPGEIGERMSVGKYYIIKVVFEPPLAPGSPVTRRVAYNIYGAFTGEDVSFMFVGDYPTDDVIFRVEFPTERLPNRTRAYVKKEGRVPKPAELRRSPDGAELEWRVSRLKPGVQYHLEWNW